MNGKASKEIILQLLGRKLLLAFYIEISLFLNHYKALLHCIVLLLLYKSVLQRCLIMQRCSLVKFENDVRCTFL